MANVLTAPEDFVNAALGRIGYKRRIGSMLEGSEAGMLALDIYGQTRDFLLSTKDWDFARASAVAVPVAAPVPQPWSFIYQYPINCVRVRDIISPAYLADQNDPLPINFTRDTAVVNGVTEQVILCNIAGATLVFTEQVIDPSLWQEFFGEALIDALALRLSKALADEKQQAFWAPIAEKVLTETADIIG
jgi:hypothetical protein